MKQLLICVFSDRVDAEKALLLLETEGVDPKDISLLMKDMDTDYYSYTHDDRVLFNNEKTVHQDTILQGISGMLSGLGMASSPDIGLLLISGPIFSQMYSYEFGGILKKFTSLGLSDDEAMEVVDRLREGNLVLAMQVYESEIESVLEALHHFHTDLLFIIDSTILQTTDTKMKVQNEYDYSQQGYFSDISKNTIEVPEFEDEQLDKVGESLKEKLKKLFK